MEENNITKIENAILKRSSYFKEVQTEVDVIQKFIRIKIKLENGSLMECDVHEVFTPQQVADVCFEQFKREIEIDKDEGSKIAKDPHYLSQFFTYKHLPEHLQGISMAASELANEMDALLPENQEKDAGMRKLLEAKDCFVRAIIFK